MWRLQIGCTKAHSEGTRVVRSGSVWVVLSPIAPLRNSKSPGGLRIAFWGRWIWSSCTMKMRSAQGATVTKTCRKKFEIKLCRNELQTRFACFRSTLLHWLTVTIVVVRSYDVSLVLRGFSCVFSFAIWVSALRISSLRTSLGVSLEIFITCPKSLLSILNVLSKPVWLCLVRL